jgi:hypothetical protein
MFVPSIFRDELYQIILPTLRGIFSFDFNSKINFNKSVQNISLLNFLNYFSLISMIKSTNVTNIVNAEYRSHLINIILNSKSLSKEIYNKLSPLEDLELIQ